MKKLVYCQLQVEGTHNWPSCHIQEVEYLKYEHRHIFHIKAEVNVYHNDRDIEFIWLKHQIQSYLRNEYFIDWRGLHVFGAKSCEMLAEELIGVFNLTACEVNEDGENGCRLEVD